MHSLRPYVRLMLLRPPPHFQKSYQKYYSCFVESKIYLATGYNYSVLDPNERHILVFYSKYMN